DLSELDGLKMRLSLMHLIEPEAGMGEMFKVLIQRKGIDGPLLEGLRDFNSIPWPTPPSPLHCLSGQRKDNEDRRGHR
ncbi:MAG: hypothetical protein Q8P64_07615, partial [Deltaproteobacteria bacterium]|nr:hypothetical protein [Deltaproteobacteria bacterium]